jgi:hypothetical protein
MSTTELEEVQALLGHVLPDPAGFAGRLFQQAMTRWGQLAEPGTNAFYTAATAPAASTFYTAAEADDMTASESVMTSHQPTADETPIDTNILLAGALGACECWGLQADCDMCRGRGSAGWLQPNLELFEEFVGPAIAKLPGISPNIHEKHGSVQADENSENHQTAQGEKA